MRILCLFLLAPAAFASECENSSAKLSRGPQLVFTPEGGLRFLVGHGESPKEKRTGALLTSMASPFWLREMNVVLQKIARDDRPISVYDKMLSALDVTHRTHGLDVEAIPKTGPLIITATHPLFGLDGLTIASLVKRVRPDVKMVANQMMGMVPGFQDESIGVDLDGGSQAADRRTFRQMVEWVKGGHAMIIFPSAEITTSPTRPQVWSRSAAVLVRLTGATVLPVFVHGRPGLFYRVASPFIGKLKKSFYPVEILKRRGSTVDLTLGELITPQLLSRFSNDEDAIRFIRDETYRLGAGK